MIEISWSNVNFELLKEIKTLDIDRYNIP